MGTSLSKPARIGAYDIIDVIGRGGMGTVFKGNDPRIGRQVAIKVLTAAADDPDLLIRFYREAKYTGSLHHQNIVTVYELGHQDGVPYLVMEYLEGLSLETVITSKRPMRVAEKLGIILQVCSGLSYAHKRDLVHRDIKPANIVILDDGTAKIVDFGIALLGGSRLTRTGHVVGSLNYMSPEQLSGNLDVDVRTDVYSTGVVLYQLLTGVLPFEGGTTAATLKKIMQDPPPPLGNYMNDAPDAELEGVLTKALAKDREQRYGTAEDFSIDLARVHQRYEKAMLEELIEQASESLRRNDLTASRQQALQVLRISPQNNEAADLLRQIKQTLEQQQREQQIAQTRMKAEEAIRKNHLDAALQYIEQGMVLDPHGTVFSELKDAVQQAQARIAAYRAALRKAEIALRAEDLDVAKGAVEEAQRILPDDAEARTLAAQIIARLEQRLREQHGAEEQRRFAIAVNTVEKAMADARMQLFLGQIIEASRVLEDVQGMVAQLPPRWGRDFAALKQDIEARRLEQSRPVPTCNEEVLGRQTTELPAQFNATVMMQPPSENSAGVTRELPQRPTAENAVQPTKKGTGGWSIGDDRSRDFLLPRDPPQRAENSEIAPELREFVEAQPRSASRSMIWLGTAVIVLAAVLVWLIVRPSAETRRHTSTVVQTISGFSYAEINAEPWATVTAVSPASGDAQSAIGQPTPLRIKLPPGQYSVTMEGPNHEQKQVDCAVPEQGGTSCFAVFNKPDVSRIVGTE